MQKLNHPIQLELPHDSLTVADIIGRAARFTRTHYRIFGKIFLIPLTLYCIGWQMLYWLMEMTDSLVVRAVAVVLCFFVILAMFYWMRVISVAFWLLVAGNEDDFSRATKKANRLTTLLVFLPNLILELIMTSWITVLIVWLDEVSNVSSGTDKTYKAVAIFVSYFALLLISILPIRIFQLVNLFFAYHMLVSEKTLKAGLKQTLQLLRREGWLIFWAFNFFVVVENLIETPNWLGLMLEGSLVSTAQTNKALTAFLAFLPRLVLEVFTGVITWSISTILIPLFDNELRVRIEAKDVTDSLSRLRQNST